MKNNKLKSILLSALVGSFFFVGCSSDDDNSSSGGGGETPGTDRTYITVAGAVMGTNNPTSWRRKWRNIGVFNFKRRCSRRFKVFRCF